MFAFSATEITAALGLFAAFAVIAWALFYLFRHYRGLRDLQPRGWDRRGSQAERNRARVEIASIRTNVIALLVISLVGAMQFGFEVWRQTFSKPSGELGSVVEELLNRKMLDAEILERQHREIVDAIRDGRPSTVSVPVDDAALRADLLKLRSSVENLQKIAQERFSNMETLGSIAWAVVAALSLVGVLFLVRAYFEASPAKKALDIAAAAALVIPSLFGVKLATQLKFDFALIKDSQVKLPDFIWHSDSKAPPEPQAVDIHLDLSLKLPDSPATKMDCRFRVGPFIGGKPDLDERPRKALDDVAAKLAAEVIAGHVAAIWLVGSADRRSLKPETAKNYDTNQGLAQARNATVQKALQNALKKREEEGSPPVKEMPSITGVYAGHTMTGSDIPVSALAVDRNVQICLFKTSDKPAQTLDKPAETQEAK
jgi:hypothetical protein